MSVAGAVLQSAARRVEHRRRAGAVFEGDPTRHLLPCPLRDRLVGQHLGISKIGGAHPGRVEAGLQVVEVAELRLARSAVAEGRLADRFYQQWGEPVEVSVVVAHRDDAEPKVPQGPVVPSPHLPQLGAEPLHPLLPRVAHQGRSLGPAATVRNTASIVVFPAGVSVMTRCSHPPVVEPRPSSSIRFHAGPSAQRTSRTDG